MDNVPLRKHPSLLDMVESCQSRHADDEELDIYLSLAPEHAARARAATEVRDVEAPIIRKVIKRIFEVYPYEKHHDLAVTKATRDVRLVVVNCSLAMLLGDPDWLNAKLLLWLKRILQAFRFPDKEPQQEYVFRDATRRTKVQSLQPYQRSIYETFALLQDEMEKALTPDSYREIEPYLSMVTEILSQD
jgi:hypothetical protein